MTNLRLRQTAFIVESISIRNRSVELYCRYNIILYIVKVFAILIALKIVNN